MMIYLFFFVIVDQIPCFKLADVPDACNLRSCAMKTHIVSLDSSCISDNLELYYDSK